MSAGKILVSDEEGDYLLKFVGDVRVTLCGSLNRYMDRIFGSNDAECSNDQNCGKGVKENGLWIKCHKVALSELGIRSLVHGDLFFKLITY